ncbi:hypothetical protein TNCV_2637261 [Trichonephila clavipes]|nr:hypothetical protein TNCV_2637261 [Trichonephila clavipes]
MCVLVGLATKTVLTRLAMETSGGLMKETGNSFYAASSVYHTSSTVLAGEEWQANLLATNNQMFISGNHAGQDNN